MLVKKDKVVGAVLSLIESSSTFVTMAIAPQLIKRLGLNQKKKIYQRKHYINQTLQKLFEKGLIEFKLNSQGVKCARLTKKGRVKLERYRLAELKIERPKHWDGKYRLVIFDIKEWKRGTRGRVRRWLEHLGFVRLQNSVWVFPYECEEVVALLKSHFRIGQEVLYLRVESIENDYWLKKEFALI